MFFVATQSLNNLPVNTISSIVLKKSFLLHSIVISSNPTTSITLLINFKAGTFSHNPFIESGANINFLVIRSYVGGFNKYSFEGKVWTDFIYLQNYNAIPVGTFITLHYNFSSDWK